MYTFSFLLDHAVKVRQPLIFHLHGGSDVEDQAPFASVRIP
jgi:hypothetical protein